jgi:prepilin peptidase CpaA
MEPRRDMMFSIIGLFAFIYVMVAFYTDIRWMIIPNWLTLSAAGLGIVIQMIIYHWSGLITSLIGFSVAFVLTLGLYLIKGVGAGDVKGLAALGAITGVDFTISVLIISLIYAGIVGLLILVVRGRAYMLIHHWWICFVCYFTTREQGHLQLITAQRVHSFPFMLAVMPAFITCLLIF